MVATTPSSVGLKYAVNPDGETCTIRGIGTCKDTNLVIPKVINGVEITYIGDYAFYACNSIIELKCNTDFIGNNAFKECKSLKKVEILSTSKKLKIDKESVLRSEVYTRYVDDNHVLRTMASVMVPRGLQSIKDDIKPNRLLACVGLVYRRDQIDRIHSGVHHQMDLWYTSEKPVSEQDMQDMINIIVKVVTGDPNAKYEVIPKVHPYTLDGREIDVIWNGMTITEELQENTSISIAYLKNMVPNFSSKKLIEIIIKETAKN